MWFIFLLLVLVQSVLFRAIPRQRRVPSITGARQILHTIARFFRQPFPRLMPCRPHLLPSKRRRCSGALQGEPSFIVSGVALSSILGVLGRWPVDFGGRSLPVSSRRCSESRQILQRSPRACLPAFMGGTPVCSQGSPPAAPAPTTCRDRAACERPGQLGL